MDFENVWLMRRDEAGDKGGGGIDVLVALLHSYHETLEAAEELLIELAEERLARAQDLPRAH